MTRPEDDSDAWLDADLAALKDMKLPSDAFLASLTTQALVAQPMSQARVSRPSVMRQILDTIGGWGGLSGLAMATCVGFAVGLSGPEVFDTTLGGVLDLSNLGGGSEFTTSAFGWDFEEG